jgi:two-component system response regulator DegU
MKKINILLVDDHQLVLIGFKHLLAKFDLFEVVGIAKNGMEAIEMCGTLPVDVVLMDVYLPIVNGFEATTQIKHLFPSVKVIMLSMRIEDEFIINADRAGADGYLSKNIDKVEFVEAITTVFKGEKYYSKELSPEIVFNVRNKKYNHIKSEKNMLTPREIMIVQEISFGNSIKAIADKLFISDRTVNTHKTNIYKKLEVKNSVELLLKVKEKNLI